ncbi:iron ABC transporter permease [Bacillaceae bacterium SIJ1]|uniref:ABC transporter permease n=1 Tax=Litoribacterium kuwaitense TaxID=1398745 RepID=UPI0013EB7A2E|nr:iron ABC transporter permease [Litoribacterium kuwaitense]NGP46794.1 iron ABC transporter permease [Litoribacterium kuwaitense]
MKSVLHAIRRINIWAVLSFLFIVMILLPNLVIVVNFFTPGNENWQHIKDYLLVDILSNTAILLVFTGITTTLIGTSLAWIVTVYKFPLRNFLKWGLILPLAVPPFIGAYTYHGMLDYTGVIQATLRNQFQIEVDQKHFDIMSLEGSIFIFTLFLYPYIYVITKSFFEQQSASIVENARLLGANSVEVFFRVILPMSRAAIIGGVTIVLLEVINDYGVVKYFGVQTFITSIFQTWFAMGDIDSAFKIAGTLMIVVIVILLFEHFIRGRKRFSYASTKIRPIQPKQLVGFKAWLAFGYAFLVFSLALLIPLLQLLYWAFMTYEDIVTVEFITLVKNSFMVAAIAAFLIVVVALIIANYTRLYRSFFSKVIARITVLGYSIPGAIIAVGVITIFIALDDLFFSLFALFGQEPGFVLKTSLIMLIFAYVIRFLTVGYNSIESGFEKVGNTFTEASMMLGVPPLKTFFKVDIPLVKGAVVSGFILVFVDILKELPLTMLLQPFNFQTLSTKAFQYANDEMVNEAASASLLIIIISGICIFIFHKVLDKGEQS